VSYLDVRDRMGVDETAAWHEFLDQVGEARKKGFR
jgi:hypothetical protein